jgi:hypothetical protein
MGQVCFFSSALDFQELTRNPSDNEAIFFLVSKLTKKMEVEELK